MVTGGQKWGSRGAEYHQIHRKCYRVLLARTWAQGRPREHVVGTWTSWGPLRIGRPNVGCVHVVESNSSRKMNMCYIQALCIRKDSYRISQVVKTRVAFENYMLFMRWNEILYFNLFLFLMWRVCLSFKKLNRITVFIQSLTRYCLYLVYLCFCIIEYFYLFQF